MDENIVNQNANLDANQEYKNKFQRPAVIVGSITLVLAIFASFLPSLYLQMRFGIWPDTQHLFTAWRNTAVAFAVFYVVEPLCYFPIFGLAGNYIGILSGNMSTIRLPVSIAVQSSMGVQPSTKKGEIVAILAICGSVVTNIIFLTIAVVAGTAIMSVLPEAVTNAMSSYILPSLFGACFAQMAIKKMKITVFALPVILIMLFVGVPDEISILLAIFLPIVYTYVLYKKGQITD